MEGNGGQTPSTVQASRGGCPGCRRHRGHHQVLGPSWLSQRNRKKRTGIPPLLKIFTDNKKYSEEWIALGSDCEKINIGVEATAVMANGCGFW
jgi:hypothetical protein